LLRREIFSRLGTVQQSGGKVVSAWAFEGELRPPRRDGQQSLPGGMAARAPGRMIEIPEVDRGGLVFPSPRAESVF